MQRPSWNEGRLDDLNTKVDKGIDRLDGERKEFRGEMRAGFKGVGEEFKLLRGEMGGEFKAVRAEMKTGFDKVDERFDRIDERFDQLTRFLLGGALAIVVGPHQRTTSVDGSRGSRDRQAAGDRGLGKPLVVREAPKRRQP